jgi:hypothetical protein
MDNNETTSGFSAVPLDIPVRRVSDEIIDGTEYLRREVEFAQAKLDAAAQRASASGRKTFADLKTLSRALVECAEIRSYEARLEFVFTVFQKLNKETPNA